MLTKNNVRIIAHRNPDGDSLGSCFALCEVLKSLGKRAEVVCSDAVPKKITVLSDGKTELLPTFTPDYTVSVDVATEDLLGNEYRESASEIDLAIDHHCTNTNYAKNLILDAGRSSAGELLYALLEQCKVPLTSKAALLLYAAIASDTGCFKFSNTTPETHIIAGELLKFNINTEELNKKLFDEASIDYMRFECEVISNMKLYDENIVFFIVTKEMMERNNVKENETDALSYLLRRISGAKVGATLREADGNVRVSLRSFCDVNVAMIASELGGGGHVKASGCRIAADIAAAEEILIKTIRNHTTNGNQK